MTAWPTTTPRRWQAEALPLALASIKAKRRGVVSAVMGSGKSVLIAEVCASGKGRVVVTVPSIALVEQLHGTIAARCGAEVGRYYTHAKEADKRVTICCLPSLPQMVADPAFTPPALWIADEAHKTEAPTVLASHSALQPVASLGFSATPFLADEDAALSLWQEIVYSYTAADAMADGVVVPVELLHWTGGEVALDVAAVAKIREVLHHGPGLANAVDIADAESFALVLQSHAIKALAIHSRLNRAEQAARIQALRDGEIAALVHVSLLTEGVDLPWLRWMAMRRPVGSRVRFCQEVGRLLRSSPGKDRAYLIDLHDLFGSFGLTYEAALGEGMAKAAKAKLPPDEQAAADVVDSDFGREPIAAVKAWRRYLRTLVSAFAAAGIVEPKISGKAWRSCEPSDKQQGAVRWAMAGHKSDTNLPLAHRKALAVVAEHAAELNRGDVSDLLTIGFALRDRRKERLAWPKLDLGDDLADQI